MTLAVLNKNNNDSMAAAAAARELFVVSHP